jgi:hypothetical protein
VRALSAHPVCFHVAVSTLLRVRSCRATLVQFEADVPVWTNKQYAPRPVLSSADKGIPVYRRWVTQFCHEGSISYEEAAKQHLRDKLGLPAGCTTSW